MKATGIVRRIDDLGRVVIPKEIRRTLRIREGDQLEIFTEKDGEVIFRKYSPVGEIGSIAGDCAESLHRAAASDSDSISIVISADSEEAAEDAVTEVMMRLGRLRS